MISKVDQGHRQWCNSIGHIISTVSVSGL